MSTVKAARHHIGISATPTQNFTLTAEALDGSMKLARGNPGATTQDILTVDNAGYLYANVVPPQFDNTGKLATTSFVQQALGSFSGIVGYSAAGTVTLTAADIGKHIVVNLATSIVLPAASSVAAGATLHILVSGVTDSTISRAGSDLITRNDGQSVTSVAVKANTSLILRQGTGGTTWIVCGGDASLQYSPLFASSTSASGYQKLPSGLILQWGTWTPHATPGNPVAVTFPITFPTALRAVIVSSGGNTTTSPTQSAWSSSQTTTGFDARTSAANTTNGQWFAIGF